MNVPETINKQLGKRMSLINLTMEMSATSPPVESLKTPILLVMYHADHELLTFYEKLMKTRKKYIFFRLNGRTFIVARRQAIDIVSSEMKLRGLSRLSKQRGCEP